MSFDIKLLSLDFRRRFF